ncbi:MAG TPA: hypothetical protein VI172_08150 [Candidatus Dormibacteraeota bacterium]|jgi:hypothetical protein
MTWAEIDGRPECVGVTVISMPAGSGKSEAYLQILTASVLRQVPVADFIADGRAELAPPVEATGAMRKSAADRLRLAAEVYQRALREKRKPTKAVAEHFGISSGGASNLVARARAAGLLPPTSSGKAIG